jgi:hypothetical protein
MHGDMLYDKAFQLMGWLLTVGSGDEDSGSAVTRCWEAELISSGLSAGIIEPSQLLRKLALRVAHLTGALEAEIGHGDENQIRQIATRVSMASAELAGHAQLAFMVADSATRAQPSIQALATSLPTAKAPVQLFSGEGLCNFATKVEQFANRARGAAVLVQDAERGPLDKMVSIAEHIQKVALPDAQIAIGPAEAIHDLAATKLADLMNAFPTSGISSGLGVVGKGADLLAQLGNFLFKEMEVCAAARPMAARTAPPLLPHGQT